MPRVFVPGVGKVTFPDAMAPEQIAQAIERDILPKAAGMQQQKVDAGQRAVFQEESTANKALVGAGRGLMDVATGIAQIGLQTGNKLGLVDDSTVSDFQSNQDAEQGLYNTMSEGSTAAKVGRFAGSAAPAFLVPGGGSLASAAGAGAIVGAAQYVPEGGSRFFNTAAGAAGGAAGFGLGKLIGKTYNAIKGTPGKASLQPLLDVAKKHGINLSLGDITKNASISKAEVGMESIPLVGLSKFREGQAGQVKKAMGAMVGELETTLKQTPYQNIKAVEAAATKGDEAAKVLLDQIQTAGDDWTQVLQNSTNLNLWNKRQVANKLYDQVSALSSDAPLPLNTTKNTLDNAIGELGKAKIPDQGQIGLLKKLRQNLDTGPGVDNSFDQIRRLRSDLGDKVRDMSMNDAKAASILKQVKGAVTKDMEEFATRGNPALKEAWKAADSYYRAEVVPLKTRALANAMKSATPDEIFGKFIQADKGDRADLFFSALDSKGQAAVRYGLVNTAFEKATNEATEAVSPAKFASYLEKMEKPRDAFFKGVPKFELDGFINLMRHSERAGQYMEKPPTGNRILQFGLGLGAIPAAVMQPAAVAGVASTSLILKALFTTQAGRNFLLASSRITPGSKAMESLIQNAESKLPALAVSNIPAISNVAEKAQNVIPFRKVASDDTKQPPLTLARMSRTGEN